MICSLDWTKLWNNLLQFAFPMSQKMYSVIEKDNSQIQEKENHLNQ